MWSLDQRRRHRITVCGLACHIDRTIIRVAAMRRAALENNAPATRSGSVLLAEVNDLRKGFRIKTAAADESTIDLGLRHQLGDVRRLD